MSALSKQRLTVTDKRNELASNPYTGADKRHTEDQPDECVCVCVSTSLPHTEVSDGSSSGMSWFDNTEWASNSVIRLKIRISKNKGSIKTISFVCEETRSVVIKCPSAIWVTVLLVFVCNSLFPNDWWN